MRLFKQIVTIALCIIKRSMRMDAEIRPRCQELRPRCHKVVAKQVQNSRAFFLRFQKRGNQDRIIQSPAIRSHTCTWTGSTHSLNPDAPLRRNQIVKVSRINVERPNPQGFIRNRGQREDFAAQGRKR